MNAAVGHEITHVLEGTEFYDSLKQTIFDYAKAKGEYQSRYDSLSELYKDIKDTDIEDELTADLVGDYLFSDPDFINNLSTQNRNVFQKIFDEIKYLCKVVTAGSKEARELEKVKRAFEEAYRESGTQKNTADGGVKYKISDLEIDREYIDFKDFQKANLTIDEKTTDMVSRGKTVELSADSITGYETGADWSDKKAVRSLLKDILKPFMGIDVQFEHNGNTATAYLTKTAINHSVGGDASPKKAAAFEMFNDLVKKAEYVFSSNNDRHSKSEQNIDGDIYWDTFVSVGTVNGKPYPVVFKIRSIDSDVRSQICQMTAKKETGFSHGDGSKENQTDAHPNYGTSPISDDKLTQKDNNVKYPVPGNDGDPAITEQQNQRGMDSVSNDMDIGPVRSLSNDGQQHTPDSLSALRLESQVSSGKNSFPDRQQAFVPDSGTENKDTRKEYHHRIIEDIKSKFKLRGFDFDEVLKNSKNLSTWRTVDNTPQRVMEKALGYKEGGILADITVNKVALNESEGIKWLNSYVDQLKKISKQYSIKPGSRESAAAQMYAEGF